MPSVPSARSPTSCCSSAGPLSHVLSQAIFGPRQVVVFSLMFPCPGGLYWSHNPHRALPGPSKIGNPNLVEVADCRPEWKTMSMSKATKVGPHRASLGVQGLHVVNIADDSDEELSETESEHLETQSRPRRLRLIWRENQNVEWHRDVRLAECLVRNLASRIGPQLPGAQIPAAVCRQRWSPLIVPLFWAAAGQDDSTPVLQWLMHVLSEAPQVEFHGNHMSAARAVEVGWNSLKESFRTWGITAREHLTLWLRRQGFPGTRSGNHIGARAQEFIMTPAGPMFASLCCWKCRLWPPRCTLPVRWSPG